MTEDAKQNKKECERKEVKGRENMSFLDFPHLRDEEEIAALGHC